MKRPDRSGSQPSRLNSEAEADPETYRVWIIIGVVVSFLALVGALALLDLYGPGTQSYFNRRARQVIKQGMTIDEVFAAITNSGDLRVETPLNPKSRRFFTVAPRNPGREPIIRRLHKFARTGNFSSRYVISEAAVYIGGDEKIFGVQVLR